jgi:hypothetical protein
MPAAQRPDWKGRTVVCIASGPSLTQEDCDAVHAAGMPTIVTNTTFRRAPWADMLFGFDSKWWRSPVEKGFDGRPWSSHRDEVYGIGFKGRLVSASQIASNLGIESTFCVPWFRQYANSGACAISMALAGGALRIVLLGFDCQNGPNGEKHWHGDHAKGLSNCLSMPRWGQLFKRVAEDARTQGVPVINATRSTALRWFPRMDLIEALTENVTCCG